MTKVILYSTQFCPWCHRTREFFLEHKIKYKNIDVGRNIKAAQKMIKKSGQQGVPVIDIEGQIIVGYEENALKKALNIK